jgi:hypothetical protein
MGAVIEVKEAVLVFVGALQLAGLEVGDPQPVKIKHQPNYYFNYYK